MMLFILTAYTFWVTVGCIVAVATARLARYSVASGKDYGFLWFLGIISMGPLAHFWLKKRGY